MDHREILMRIKEGNNSMDSNSSKIISHSNRVSKISNHMDNRTRMEINNPNLTINPLLLLNLLHFLLLLLSNNNHINHPSNRHMEKDRHNNLTVVTIITLLPLPNSNNSIIMQPQQLLPNQLHIQAHLLTLHLNPVTVIMQTTTE